MIHRLQSILLVVLLLMLPGCSGNCMKGWNGYGKCRGCGAAFRMDGGLPDQHSNVCRHCGGEIYKCSKTEAGWDDSKPGINPDGSLAD